MIGSHADIEAARLNDVRDFFQHYYTPNNASVAIAGDFDRAKVKALVEKYFGPIPRGPEVEKPVVVTPPIESRAASDGDRYRAAAAGLDRMADAGGVQAGGRGSGFFHAACWVAARPAGCTASWCMNNRSRKP